MAKNNDEGLLEYPELTESDTEDATDILFEVVMAPLKPSEIEEELNKYVVGQEEAKRLVSIVVANHLAVTLYNQFASGDEKVVVKKSNIMLVGASGSGKTYILECLKKVADIDLLITDFTQFTQAGYKGRDPVEMISDAYYLCNRDKERTENCIIFIDEIDKITGYGGNDREFDRGVQMGLIKIVEGTRVEISGKEIDTSNILFVFGGAFAKFTKEKSPKAKCKKSAGFLKAKCCETEGESFKIDHEQLVEAGVYPELAGRIAHIANLKPLTKEQMKTVIKDTKNSYYDQMQILGHVRDLDLSLTEAEIDDIIEKAYAMNVGARGIKAAMETKMLERMYN